MEENMKRMVIMRGLPGSGKSTLAGSIALAYSSNGVVVGKYSTDDYFHFDGRYQFRGDLIDKAHKWNFSRVQRAVDLEFGLVVVDNTHTQFWELVQYVELAKKNGYEIQIAEPKTEWAKDIDLLVVRNTHGVPRTSIQKMIDRWDETDDLIQQFKEKAGVNITKVSS